MNYVPGEYFALTLYFKPICLEAHWIRMILAEKDIEYNIHPIDNTKKLPEDLITLNPSGVLPTLTERSAALYGTGIICEYLDERFPHPPLLPAEPISRARLRMALSYIRETWVSLMKRALSTNKVNAKKASQKLNEDILAHTDLFKEEIFFSYDEITLLDCLIAPLLWRLPSVGINLNSKEAKPILRYQKNIFMRPSFRKSITEEELDLYPE